MTNEKVDKLMQKVLLDAIELEWKNVIEGSETAVLPSPKFQKEMQAMLKDPNAWCRKKTTSAVKKVAKIAATILIVVSLSVGFAMAVSPTARAIIHSWIVEIKGNYITYRYNSEDVSKALGDYEIAALPDDYEEIERRKWDVYETIAYEHRNGNTIYFSCAVISMGGATVFNTAGDEISEIIVNGYEGCLMVSNIKTARSSITWIDTDKNIQFVITGDFTGEELIQMAESVTEK